MLKKPCRGLGEQGQPFSPTTARDLRLMGPEPRSPEPHPSHWCLLMGSCSGTQRPAHEGCPVASRGPSRSRQAPGTLQRLPHSSAAVGRLAATCQLPTLPHAPALCPLLCAPCPLPSATTQGPPRPLGHLIPVCAPRAAAAPQLKPSHTWAGGERACPHPEEAPAGKSSPLLCLSICTSRFLYLMVPKPP